MVERLSLAVAVIALSSTAWLTTGCEGGCFSQADRVVVQPANDCLQLFVGNPDSGTICGSPELQGTNTCDEALILPPAAPGDTEHGVAAGAPVFYTMNADSPGIRLMHRDDDTQWIIDARLGNQPIAIAVGIHEK